MVKKSDLFDANCESVFNLFELLTSYVTGKKNPPPWLTKACSSQGAIAALSKPEMGIRPMSLNTFKKCAEYRLVGGFKQFDELRIKIKDNPVPKKKPRVSTDKNELHEAQRLRVTLTRAYQDLMRIAQRASRGDAVIERELAEHQVLYGQYFGVVGVSDD